MTATIKQLRTALTRMRAHILEMDFVTPDLVQLINETDVLMHNTINANKPDIIDGKHIAACQNCDWRGPRADLNPIQHIHQRVAPGEPMPAGECPRCGCLAHIKRSPDHD